MAAVWIYRLSLALGGGSIAVRSTQWGSGQPGPQNVLRHFYDRLTVDEAEMAVLSEEMSEYAGYSWHVATYSGTFELRKLILQFTQLDGPSLADDPRQCSIHLLKTSAGSPVSEWVAGDFTAVGTAVDAWWTAIKANFNTGTKLDKIKLYKAGPAIVPPQPPVYDAERDVAGTNANEPFPPQVAVSVTELAGTKPYWGRFYLPAPSNIVGNSYGRITSGYQTAFADATDTMYQAFVTAGLTPVVYRQALPVREKKNGTELPERAASAWSVEKIQIDDVFDIIRSRRWKYPTLRVQRDIS